MIDLVRESERRGLDFVGFGDGLGRAVFPELVALAQATDRIRVITMVSSIFASSFLQIAAGIAFLDVISNGRACLGLGSSIPHYVNNQLGIKFERPAQRMKEYVQIIRRLLTKQTKDLAYLDALCGGVDYQGEIFQLRGATIDVEPVQERLPIYVAAVGPRMLEIAGEVADGVMVEFVSPGYIKHARKILDIGARRAGRDASQMKIMAHLFLSVADRSKDAIEALKPIFAYDTAFPVYDSLWVEAGLMDAALRVREYYSRGDFEGAARAVPDEMVRTLAIAGTKQECRRQLQARIEMFETVGIQALAIAPSVPSNMEQGYRDLLDVIG
jgi:alkanesulfonate monooxygenase SsuD/methylene tetrahydromethanopterin reductase-like flavin-dependent oxidoreductase (luciferase family)